MYQAVGDVSEEERLASLQASGLLEPSETDDSFDRITRLARTVLRVDGAMVSLVDRNRQMFKSHVGLSGRMASESGSDLDRSFCKVAVASGKPFLIEDARADPLVRNSPLVTEDGIEAYAGAPLKISTGHIFGTLCVFEETPRRWSEAEVEILEDFAAMTVAEIEYRMKTREVAGLEALAHRLPGPVARLGDVVRSTAALVDTPDDPRLPRMAEQARYRLAAVEALTQDLAQSAASTRTRRPSGPLRVDLTALVQRICRLVGSAARPEDLEVRTGDEPVYVTWEGPDLGQGLSLVVMAALHHLGPGQRADVSLTRESEHVRVSVTSPGRLMPVGDLLRASGGFVTDEGATSNVTSRQRQTTVRNGPLSATTSASGSRFELVLPLRTPVRTAGAGGSSGLG
ncbi:GAF domain-containing protein [Nocardioides sp.]|uniref:GAF domain-containing protein n=1 Tax=Nocardioides sp. TaxID=35761 RepID=UPI002D0FB112|nr:GAF domain-containing protein [Nocardioides sp.]HXH80231.1 GAF domain-containing protein [Nocardioides sp.]